MIELTNFIKTDEEIKKKKEKEQQKDVGRTVISFSVASVINVYKGKLSLKVN